MAKEEEKIGDTSIKNMSRKELVELLYHMRIYEEQLQQELEEKTKQLEERTIQMEQAGNIAQAALEINHVFEAAQAAADQYLFSVRNIDVDRDAILREAEEEKARILEDAGVQIEALEEQKRSILEKADTEAQRIVLEARTQAEEEKQKVLAGAKEEGEQIVAAARAQAEDVLRKTREYCVEQLTKIKQREQQSR